MRASALEHLSPSGQLDSNLTLEVFEENGAHIAEGILRQKDGSWFPIINGVPSFLTGLLQSDLSAFASKHGLTYERSKEGSERDADQALTNETFSDKWRRFKSYGLEASHQEFLFDWYCKKLGVENEQELKAFYGKKSRILECGPGSGFNSRFMAQNCPGDVFALDISDAAFTTFGNTQELPNCTVVQADLMEAPFPEEFFDFIIADGVLHHTPNTRAAVEALYQKLTPGGQFFFYVYKKMGAARAFCDEHIRNAFMHLTPEECYAACESLTELGRALSNLNVEIKLEKPVPVLGIPEGTHDVQRLIYYNFVKCFWNDAFDFETNNMVNFDWYHPHNAWQHTEEEVVGWLEDLGVSSYEINDANPNGISVLLTK